MSGDKKPGKRSQLNHAAWCLFVFKTKQVLIHSKEVARQYTGRNYSRAK